MRSRLFLVLHSPAENDVAEKIELLSGGSGGGVLLVEDGVYHAIVPEHREALLAQNVRIYAATECLASRGYGNFAHPDVEVVDPSRSIDLVMDDYDGVIRV
jgi:sulfur relay protein TusB/DsrH